MAAQQTVRPGAMGFHDLDPATKPKRRLIVSVEGPEKSGKNHFAFTFPGVIVFHSTDHGDEGMIEKFVQGRGVEKRKIKKAQYRVDVPEGADEKATSKACEPVWSAFRTNYRIGLATCRSTVVDTGTDIYELIRMTYFGKLQQVMAHHYAPVNTEMKDLFHEAYSSDGNLCILHRVKDEYITKVVQGKERADKTGAKVMAGFAQTKFETQVHLRTFKEDGEFCAEVVTCRQNPSVEGFVLTGEMLSYKGLGMLVYEDSEEGDWA